MAQSLRHSISQPSYTKAVIKAALRSSVGSLRIWCVVEAEDDVTVYSRFFIPEKVSVLPSKDESGKYSFRNVEQIVSELYIEENNPLLFGIRDKDYSSFNPDFSSTDNVFLTDCRDIEMMMLNSPSVINGLHRWNARFQDVIELSINSMRYLGYLRIFNDIAQTSCVFKDNLTKVSLIWDYGTHSLYEDFEYRLLQRFINKCNRIVSEDEVIAFIDSHKLKNEDMFDICRGHDVCKMMSIMMVNKEFSDVKSIFNKMAESYSLSDFKQTKLFLSIDSWAKNRNVSVFQ